MSQVFISLLATWGGILTWSSFGTFYNKYHFDATVIILVVPLLSALSSIAMFSVIGCLATSLSVQVWYSLISVFSMDGVGLVYSTRLVLYGFTAVNQTSRYAAAEALRASSPLRGKLKL